MWPAQLAQAQSSVRSTRQELGLCVCWSANQRATPPCSCLVRVDAHRFVFFVSKPSKGGFRALHLHMCRFAHSPWVCHKMFVLRLGAGRGGAHVGLRGWTGGACSLSYGCLFHAWHYSCLYYIFILKGDLPVGRVPDFRKHLFGSG